MAGWKQHTGRVAALPLENVDTDQIIPARFMSAPRSSGYGGYLLHDLRRDSGGNLRPDLSFNRAEGASVLVTRRNFGSGSSREAAVYALVDAGFRVVLAPSFGDIFASNAINNGLLPARLDPGAIETMLMAVEAGNALEAMVDLEACLVWMGGTSHAFEVDPVWRVKLMNGWDDIDLTASRADAIAAFRAARRQAAPWAFPGKDPEGPR